VRVITTARLIEKKGIQYAIRAVALAAKVHENIKYLIVGDGPMKSELHQLIHRLHLDPIVELVGQKDQRELIEILKASDIFIAPSITAEDGDEDAPVNTLKEAMAIGLPVIGTRHGGIPETVQDNLTGFLVPERDEKAIADKLLYLLEHPRRWSEMARAGRAYVERHYNLRTLNDQLVEIYRDVLARAGDGPALPRGADVMIAQSRTARAGREVSR
jgi:colanic acid/amylovoran biosynthesis glycosyltransferase